MKYLIITIAALVLVGCGESQQSTPAPEAEPTEPLAGAAKPETPTVKAPDISIHDAALDGNIEAVKQHLAAGTDVNAKTTDGWTPLHYTETKECAELLIAKGADINAKNERDETPLDGVKKFKRRRWLIEVADFLLKHGGKHGTIHGAAYGGDIEAVKEFLAAGTDVNAKGEDGRTPLHDATGYGHKEIVELLIAKGADVNAKTKRVGTPLHGAAANGDKEIAELLIAKGADVNAKNEDEFVTPLDWAERHPETAKLLRKHGGKTFEELKAEGK